VIPISRYDKYDPISGGFRAPLAANFAYTSSKPDWAHTNLNRVIGVGLNASGQVVIGAGNSGIVGVMILGEPAAAGDVVDVMTNGEIVEFLAGNGTAAVAGTVYTTVTTDGTYGTVAADATHIKIGWTVEATRLVVRLGA
jgi:hypothetical protein